MAFITSKRSKDPNSTHGSILVTPDNHIISLGYNGMPKNNNPINNDKFFPWHNNPNTYNKYNVVIHSEMNAILNCKDISLLRDSSLYLYSSKKYFCCENCLKHICQVGVREIIVPEIDKNNKYYTEAINSLLAYSAINVIEIGYEWYEQLKNQPLY